MEDVSIKHEYLDINYAISYSEMQNLLPDENSIRIALKFKSPPPNSGIAYAYEPKEIVKLCVADFRKKFKKVCTDVSLTKQYTFYSFYNGSHNTIIKIKFLNDISKTFFKLYTLQSLVHTIKEDSLNDGT